MIQEAPARRKHNYFRWTFWGLTSLFILQFYVPIALNSYESHFKPCETCPPCTSKSLDGESECVFTRIYCFVPPNRTCPECMEVWTAPCHGSIGPLALWIEIGLMPLTVVALRLLLPD